MRARVGEVFGDRATISRPADWGWKRESLRKIKENKAQAQLTGVTREKSHEYISGPLCK